MAELATIARPYAEAVFQMASEKKQLDPWSNVLKGLATVVQAPEFEQVALDPKITATQIVDLIVSVVEKDAQAVTVDYVKRFLKQLVDHRRLDTLPEVAKQFQKMRDASSDVAEVVIYTAYPLDDAQLKELLPILEKRFGAKLRPQIQIDESLIGGVCAVVGDDTLDMSVKARLEQMKTVLTA